MQHIGIVICEEDQKIIERSDINFVDIFKTHLRLIDQPGVLPWLETIDPYGDTTFNPRQVGYLIKDLEKLRILAEDEKVKVLTDQITIFASKILPENSPPHRYLKFIGD